MYQKIIDEYSWAQAWDPRGWYWSVVEKSQDSIDVMTGKRKPEEEEKPIERIKTVPKLAAPGTEQVVDYLRYGKFVNVGTPEYRYQIDDPVRLNTAVGEGIHPNLSAVRKNPRYKQAQKEGRLEGLHWDFVYSDDLEAAFFKWANENPLLSVSKKCN